MKILRRFLTLLKKEFIQLLKNPKTRITVIVPPILQLFIFGYAATMDLKDVRIGILDHSHTEESRAYINKFANNNIFILQPPLKSEKELSDSIAERRIKFGIVIPENFSSNILLNRPVSVQVIADGRNSSSAGIGIGYINSITTLFNQEIKSDTQKGIEIITRGWYNPNFNVRWFMIPSIIALISLIILALLVALSFAKERESGTMDQLFVTPYTPIELLAAKGLSSVMIGLIQVSFCLLIIFFWFKIPYNSSFLLLPVLLTSFISAAVGLGLAISVYCNNLQQAMIGIFSIVVPFAILSGMVTPVSSMPPILAKVMYFNPVRWAIEALHKLFLEGAVFADILPACLIMTAIGISTFSFACYSLIKQRG